LQIELKKEDWKLTKADYTDHDPKIFGYVLNTRKDNMKKIITTVFLLLIIAALPVTSWAEEQKPAEQKQVEDKLTGEVALSILSAYIPRGYEQTRNSIVVQPSVTLNYKGFSINYWGNLDTKPYSATDINYSAKYTETDIGIFYTKKFGILQVTPGYIYYVFGASNSDAPTPLDSQELFFTLQLDTLLSPALTIYKEIAHYNQWYLLLNVEHTFQLNKIVGLKLSAQASYLKSENADTYPRYDSNAQPTTDKFNNFHDGTISLCLPIAAYKTFVIIPTVSYVFPLSDDARYEMKGYGLKGAANPADNDSSFFYGGVTFSYTF
jgi:hypothetical protein